MSVISFTKVALPYGWLGNMSAYSVVDRDMEFPTAEHHFQLQRLRNNHPVLPKVLSLKSPMGAKMMVRDYEKDFIVTPLGAQDLDNMRLTLKLKFAQHPSLKDALLATGNAYLLEDVSARQTKGAAMFWGGVPIRDSSSSVPWVGKNWLGQLLMERRALLQREA